ncbi:MAG: AAA family ATPase [Alphaproteobacteria bacterium]
MFELKQLKIRNFRSLKDVTFDLESPCVITGGNGTGKSNLYKAISLVQKAAIGQFSRTITQDGGMPSMMWAGQRTFKDKKQLRMSVEMVMGP